MKLTTIGLILTLSLALAACALTRTAKNVNDADLDLRRLIVEKKPLSELDLSKIGHIAPKGRVQDQEYNRLEVVDQLLFNSRECLPYLIEKLDDETEIQPPVIDYWHRVTVGDVALIILTDFMTSPAGKTNPGAGWEELFEAKKEPNTTAEEFLRTQLSVRGRGWLKEKWRKLAIDYRGRLFWDDQLRYWVYA
jgi:hypothetical protein